MQSLTPREKVLVEALKNLEPLTDEHDLGRIGWLSAMIAEYERLIRLQVEGRDPDAEAEAILEVTCLRDALKVLAKASSNYLAILDQSEEVCKKCKGKLIGVHCMDCGTDHSSGAQPEGEKK